MPYRYDDICPTDAFLRLDQDNHAPFGDTIVELSGSAGFKRRCGRRTDHHAAAGKIGARVPKPEQGAAPHCNPTLFLLNAVLKVDWVRGA
jgi:hypothetical protein